MPMTTLSSREFNQDTSKAKKAAKSAPMFITGCGRPAHVLLSIEHYQSLVAPAASIIDLLATPGAETIRFFAPRARAREAGGADVTFLLDTNVVSELRKAKSVQANRSVTAWASKVPAGSLYFSGVRTNPWTGK